MFGGKLIRIETNESLPEVIKSLGDGYVLFSWREGGDLRRAFLFVSSGKVVGAFVESVLQGYAREGEVAVEDIENALAGGLVKAYELYAASSREILSERPTLRVSSFPFASISGDNVEGLLKLYRSFSGWLQVRAGDREWRLVVENGMTLKAHLTGENLLGDEAVLSLLREFGHVIKNGTYRFFSGTARLPEGSEVVEHSTSFLDVVESFQLKRVIESGLSF
ncbi:DUF2226 domain-containing protein [Thermococcus sp. 9N3]|uniref:DUF2226 domain-containing protein n=1 Tax=Thermococcus sp. 9N3 TaxID=163002 RepID=UPI001430CB4D|nr:DUF2226 domain-containing protein [Thermococcus sp. 9N3]NJE48900.1 DUF2226 domain-containing protein [Thermococcus sp. 9N3]